MKNPFADTSNQAPDVTLALVSKSATGVHKSIGPGWPEGFYKNALALALEKEGLRFQREVPLKVQYGGTEVGATLLDFMVEGLALMVTAEEETHSRHFLRANALLKVSGATIGIVVNFGAAKVEVKKLVANPFEEKSDSQG